jgi:hypothetical protein
MGGCRGPRSGGITSGVRGASRRRSREEDLRETTSAMLRCAPHNLDHDALAAFSHCIAAPGDVTCGAAESGAEEARQAVEVFAAKAVSSPGKPMRRAWRD